jgi:hypothetical protein
LQEVQIESDRVEGRLSIYASEEARPSQRTDIAPSDHYRNAISVRADPVAPPSPPVEDRSSRIPVPIPSARPEQTRTVTVPSELPVVKVTIGRIEVRAIPPPARERSGRVGTQPLSLEKYLERRHGRGR